MKANIAYLKTNKSLTRDNLKEITYVDGRIVLVDDNGFSVYYPHDNVTIEIIQSNYPVKNKN